MGKFIIALLGTCFIFQVSSAQKDSAYSENNVRVLILNDIQHNLDQENKAIDSTILKLDSHLGRLDSAIKMTGNTKEKIDKIIERVQLLEEKQKAIEQNEINVYEANYQSAVINLVSMDREIKPLLLFHTTRDFFNSLTATSNPMAYEGFRSGFDKFKIYINNVKEEDATQKAVADIINSTGNMSFGVPVVGAYSQLLFSGMAKYVNSIGHKKRELKKEAEKMFAITTTLSQFTTDKNMIENEWENITESLEEMGVYYDSTLQRNLRMLSVDRNGITNEFTRQSDASKRYLYLTMLQKKAADYVVDRKKEDPKDWKQNIYYQLMDVQTLKERYGDITYRIEHHLNKYTELISRYKGNPQLGDHIAILDQKLNQLKSTFDDEFEPTQYIHAATQMYKVM